MTYLDIGILLDVLALEPQHSAHRVQVNSLHVNLQCSPDPAACGRSCGRFRLDLPDGCTLDIIAYPDQIEQMPHVLRVLRDQDYMPTTTVHGFVHEFHREMGFRKGMTKSEVML